MMYIFEGMPILALYLITQIVSTSIIERKAGDTEAWEDFKPKGNNSS